MKNLFDFFNSFSHKTMLVTALMAALTFLQGSEALLGMNTIIWINFVCGVLLIIGKAIAPTGTLPKGWTAFFWITNVCAILIEIGGFFTDSGLFSADVIAAIVKIQILLNAAIAAVQIASTQKESVS